MGLGAMGWPNAAYLVKAGFRPRVFDARASEATRFAAEVGGEVASSLRALGETSDVVITMLPTSKSLTQCSSTNASPWVFVLARS